MKQVPKSFDAFSFLQASPEYCENKECEEFGYVTMVGFPDLPTPTTTNDSGENNLQTESKE